MDDGHLQITTNKKRAPLKGHNALNVELAARKPGIIKTDWSACARQRQAYKTKGKPDPRQSNLGTDNKAEQQPLPNPILPQHSSKAESLTAVRRPLAPVRNCATAACRPPHSQAGTEAHGTRLTARCLSSVGATSVRQLFQRGHSGYTEPSSDAEDDVGVSTTTVPVHRDKVLEFACTAVRAEAFNPKTLFLVGSKGLSQCSLCLAMAHQLDRKLYVSKTKRKTAAALQLSPKLQQLLTQDHLASSLHAVHLRDTTLKRMHRILRHYRRRYSTLVAFVPSGQTGTEMLDSKRQQKGPLVVYTIPYPVV